MSDISETSIWLKFFTEAGIPPSDATEYAITFTDNRIKQGMLPDITKEYLQDMGITVMGDIICILKHAKTVYGQLNRQKAFSSPVIPPTSQTQSVSISSSNQENTTTTTTSTTTKKSTAATRMLEHYVRKESPAAPPSPPPSSNLSPNLSARLGGTKRPAEDEDFLQASKRSSVFHRLGDNAVSSTTSDAPTITVTMLGKDKLKLNKEIGPKVLVKLKSDSIEKVNLIKKDVPREKPLQYHGILKYSTKELAAQKSQEEKLRRTRSVPSNIKLVETQPSSSVRKRLGLATKPISVSEGIFAHELNSLRKKKEAFPRLKTPPSSQESINTEPLVARSVIKKIVKVNKKTGQIVREERREIKSNVFSRLSE